MASNRSRTSLKLWPQKTSGSRKGGGSAFHYRNRGYYARQLKRYLEMFPREQLLILIYDDMLADCQGLLKTICAFLGVDQNHPFDTREWDNVTRGIPRGRLFRRALRSAGPAKNLMRAIFPANMRASLYHRISTVIMNPKPGIATARTRAACITVQTGHPGATEDNRSRSLALVELVRVPASCQAPARCLLMWQGHLGRDRAPGN